MLPVPEKQNLSYNEAGPHFNVIVPPGDFFPPPQISGVHAVHQYKSTNSMEIEFTKLSK